MFIESKSTRGFKVRIKRQILCVAFICSLAPVVVGQRIPTSNALEDLGFLNEVIKNGHPVNYNPARDQVHIDGIIAGLQTKNVDSIGLFEFRKLLNEAIFQIGCVHTRISKSPYTQPAVSASYFPFPLQLKDGKLLDTLHNEIDRINEVPSDVLVSWIENRYASDGATKALSTAVFNDNSSVSISGYFQFPKAYSVSVNHNKASIESLAKVPVSVNEDHAAAKNAVFKNRDNYIYFIDSIPVLRISSFDKHDKGFINNAFDLIEKKQAKTLVLDLRGNLGGKRKSAVFLTRHLAQKKFEYSILQPRLKTWKYINGKGKFYLFLSILKYNVGTVFKGKKTVLGRAFTYSYKPVKNNYKGNILVLTDGYTASASTMVTSWLKQHSRATFIGLQAAGGYNGNNGGSYRVLTLPRSKYQITFPAYRLILDGNSLQNQGIIPDISHDFKENTDIKALLQKRSFQFPNRR